MQKFTVYLAASQDLAGQVDVEAIDSAEAYRKVQKLLEYGLEPHMEHSGEYYDMRVAQITLAK